MNASTPGTILGALGLAGVALLYVKVDRLEGQLAPRSLERARPAMETGPEAGDVGPARGERGPTAGFGRPGASGGGGDAGATGLAFDAGVGERSPDMGARVRELEEEVSRLRAQRDAEGMRFAPRMPRVAGTVEELANTLELSPTQTDRVRDAVDRHRRRIEDVLRIPDETGVSPWDRRQQEQKRMRDALAESGAPGILQVAMGSLMDRNRKIPGRSTTYGDEIDRIKEEARSEIGADLDPAQKKLFDELHIDPLLDQGSGSTFVSISMTAGSASTSEEPSRDPAAEDEAR